MSLRALYDRHQFNPGLLGIFVNPFFLTRRALWREMAQAAPALSGKVLDVGCGKKPYRQLFEVDEYIGLEIDSEASRARGAADAYYDGSRFPFPDGSFDAVICNQVLEHVFNPNDFVQEIARVLRPTGKLLLTVPFMWDEHEQPYDYARYSSFGIKHLLETNKLRVSYIHKTLMDVSVIAQLLNAYVFKVIQGRSVVLSYLLMGSIVAPISLLGMLCGKVLPQNRDLFMDLVVLAERES